MTPDMILVQALGCATFVVALLFWLLSRTKK